MKKKILLFGIVFALMFSLSGCGRPQSSEPSSGGSSVTGSSSADTSTPTGKPEVPEGSQPGTPAETGAPAERPDASANGSGEETSDPISTPESGSQQPAPTPESGSQQPAATPESASQQPAPTPESGSQEAAPTQGSTSEPEPEYTETSASNMTLSGTTLTMRFGGGESFTINMYDNDTANKIAEYVGTASWQLPIYHFDDSDGWESFQYYDIPSRYDIPDGSESVTSEKAGMVYYSHPNRIILFYQDANISTQYTPVGYVEFSQALVDAVENNPVVPGWGNKLVFIQP